MTHTDWTLRTEAALTWVLRSCAATGGRGSAHSWSPLFGWAKAYPETTGYLIETLLAYSGRRTAYGVRLTADVEGRTAYGVRLTAYGEGGAELGLGVSAALLRTKAFESAAWLVTLQLPSGAFPGLLAGHQQPSVFNTAQILFGLAAVLRADDCPPTLRQSALTATHRAVDWLLGILEPDGAWQQAAYVPGFTPSYYTRAVWGVLQTRDVAPWPDLDEKMHHALKFYATRFLPSGVVRDWGFWPGKPAFTHTIAYTLEGFLECATLLNDVSVLEKTQHSTLQLLLTSQRDGRTAGRYDDHWQGDTSFRCVTGNCQLSVVFSRMAQVTGDSEWRRGAQFFLSEVLDCQVLKPRWGGDNVRGALSGSSPVWGPYLRFRYPNWAVKFFLDALLFEDLKI